MAIVALNELKQRARTKDVFKIKPNDTYNIIKSVDNSFETKTLFGLMNKAVALQDWDKLNELIDRALQKMRSFGENTKEDLGSAEPRLMYVRAMKGFKTASDYAANPSKAKYAIGHVLGAEKMLKGAKSGVTIPADWFMTVVRGKQYLEKGDHKNAHQLFRGLAERMESSKAFLLKESKGEIVSKRQDMKEIVKGIIREQISNKLEKRALESFQSIVNDFAGYASGGFGYIEPRDAMKVAALAVLEGYRDWGDVQDDIDEMKKRPGDFQRFSGMGRKIDLPTLLQAVKVAKANGLRPGTHPSDLLKKLHLASRKSRYYKEESTKEIQYGPARTIQMKQYPNGVWAIGAVGSSDWRAVYPKGDTPTKAEVAEVLRSVLAAVFRQYQYAKMDASLKKFGFQDVDANTFDRGRYL